MLCVQLIKFVIGLHVLCQAAVSEEAVDYKQKYFSISKQYFELSSQFSGLSSQFSGYIEERTCADFFREYIPYVEETFIDAKNFSELFKRNNPTFSEKYEALRGEKNKVHKLYNTLLTSTGLKIKNRTACTLEYLSEDEFYGAAPPSITNLQNKKEAQLNRCEKWIYFLYVIKTSPDSKNEELRLWSRAVEFWENSKKLEYPLFAQRIMHGIYRAHKFHHQNPFIYLHSSTTPQTSEERIRNTNIRQIFTCLFKGKLELLNSSPTTSMIPIMVQLHIQGSRVETTALSDQFLDRVLPNNPFLPDEVPSKNISDVYFQ